MTKNYFDLDDDFEGIIREQLDTHDITKIKTGWTNYVYKATTNDGAYVFRFPRNDFFASALIREVEFTKYIKGKTGFASTDIEYKKHDGRGYSVHKFMSGYTLTEAYTSMTVKQKRTLATDIARYIYTLQNTKIIGMELPVFSDFLCGLAKVNNDDEYDCDEIFKSLYQQEEAMGSKLLLTHGDFNPGNILLNENYEMFAVLDYAFISYSCALPDLACVIARVPADFKDMLIQEYENISNTHVEIEKLNDLIYIRQEVEKDYIKYMARCHKDVELPTL
jgi:aminoglycoside phosphotransferase (APT) family kinase protein